MKPNEQETVTVKSVLTEDETKALLRATKPGVKDDERLSILREALEARPNVEDRVAYISSVIENKEGGEGAKAISIVGLFAATSISGKALDLLTAGLSTEDKNKMITALVRLEKDRAYARPEDENTFMRGNSLSETALMSYLKEQMTDEKAKEFIADPFKFISELPIPDHLKEVLREPLEAKIEGRAPLYGFAHNIVFSMITGPVLKHFNDKWNDAKGDPRQPMTETEAKAKQEFDKAMASVDVLTQINSVLVQTTPKGMEAAIAKTIAKNITPDHVVSYVTSLEKLSAKISDEYNPNTAPISIEALKNYSEFDISYKAAPKVDMAKVDTTKQDGQEKTDKQKPSSLKTKVSKFIDDVIQNLKSIVKDIKEWKPTPPSWTTKSSTKPNNEAKDTNTKEGVSDKKSGRQQQPEERPRPGPR